MLNEMFDEYYYPCSTHKTRFTDQLEIAHEKKLDEIKHFFEGIMEQIYGDVDTEIDYKLISHQIGEICFMLGIEEKEFYPTIIRNKRYK